MSGAGAAARRYRRAVRWAFTRVTFYREQWATAGRVLDEPEPTPLAELPQPPHTLCPFARPWSPEREPSLWTPPSLRPLAQALRTAGCRGRRPVLEIREALLPYRRLPRTGGLGRAPYRVLLSATATVSSDAHRESLNREALALATAAETAWVVGAREELATLPELVGAPVRPVHRLSVAEVAGLAELASSPELDGPAVVYEPMLGYLGARRPECRLFHLDRHRVYARERDGRLTLSLPRSRRPVLLDIVPPGAHAVALATCPRHGGAVLQPGLPRSRD